MAQVAAIILAHVTVLMVFASPSEVLSNLDNYAKHARSRATLAADVIDPRAWQQDDRIEASYCNASGGATWLAPAPRIAWAPGFHVSA